MSRDNARRYTPEQKAEIVEHYRVHGQAATLRKHPGLSASSLRRWRRAAGVVTEVASNTEAATKARQAMWNARREQVKGMLLDMVENLGGRVLASEDKDVNRIAVAFGISIDKLRLEEGQATGREEVRHEYPDIAALSDDELNAAILREAEGITRREAETGTGSS